MLKLILYISIFLYSQAVFSLALTTSIKKPNHSLLLKKNKEVVSYVPNSSFHLGIKLVGNFFFAQYSFKIPNSNFGRSNVGNDSYKDFRLGLNIGRTLLEGFYKRYKGFSSTENGGKAACDNCLIRNNLSSEESLLQFALAFRDKLVLRDIVSGANGKVTSAYSPTFHLFANRLKIRDPESLIQGTFSANHSEFDGLKELDLRQIGLGLGIGATYPLGRLLYIGGLTSASVGFQKNKFIFDDSSKTLDEFGLNYNLRINIGTHNEKYNMGLRSLIVSNLFDIGERTNFLSVNYEVRLYMSILF